MNILNNQGLKKESHESNIRGPSLKKKKTRMQINAINKKIGEEKKSNNLINTKKILPLPDDHQSGYIKNYLKYAYKKRTKKIYTINDQNLKIINNEEIHKEKNKNIEDTMDKFNKYTKTEMSKTFYDNYKTKDSTEKEEILNTFYRSDFDNRTLETDKLNELIKNRDCLKLQFKEKNIAKNIVNDILKNYNLYSYDFSYMLQSYKNTILILGANCPEEEKLYKIICSKKEEELKNIINRYSNRERNLAIKALEEVESNKLKISEDITKKLKELIG